MIYCVKHIKFLTTQETEYRYDNEYITWCYQPSKKLRRKNYWSRNKSFYDIFKEEFAWCEENCTGKWGHRLSQKLYFTNKLDATTYALKFVDN